MTTHQNATEQFYDDVIGPELARIGKLCEDNGFSFVAAAEWSPGEYGSTRAIGARCSFGIRLVDTAIKANGNVDSLIMAIERHAREKGHSSMYLNQLGVPLQPVTA